MKTDETTRKQIEEREDGQAAAARLMDLVDASYIDEAAEAEETASAGAMGTTDTASQPRKVWYNKKTWRAAAMAACLCLVIAGTAAIAGVTGGEADGTAGQGASGPSGQGSGQRSQAAAAGDEKRETDKGIHVPAVELPGSWDPDVAMDMLACVVYKGGIYVENGFRYQGEDASAIAALPGEFLGNARGDLDEWSTQDDYATEFAGSVAGPIYTVKGYDPSFRLCLVGDDSILFLERMNDIDIETGADVYEDRLHLPERWEGLYVLDHDTWNRGGQYKTDGRAVNIADAGWEDFLSALCQGTYVWLWNTEPDIYDRVVAHLYVTKTDGTVDALRLTEDGYVICDSLPWCGIRVSDTMRDTMLAACGL